MNPLKTLVHTRTFWCETCGAKEAMNPEQFKDHLKTVHGLDKLKGKRISRLHLDMAGGQYNNCYDWILPGGIKCTEAAEGTRK